MNPHPLIVHFPIALIIVGVICDAVGILSRRSALTQTGYLIFTLGAVSALMAALTGENAAELARHIPGITDDLNDHDDLGTVAAWLSIALVLVRTHLTFKKKFTGPVQYFYLALALLAAGLIGAAGYTGGHLVYHHGAGTTPVLKTLDIPPESPVPIPRTNTFQSEENPSPR